MRASTPKSDLKKQAGGLVSIQDLTYAHSTDTTTIPPTIAFQAFIPTCNVPNFNSVESLFLHS